MQLVWAGYGESARLISLPDSGEEVVRGVLWGSPDCFGTPAYWTVRCQWNAESTPSFACAASTLVEEVGFCLLGGYSVTFEGNIAAFEWLKENGVFDLSVEARESQIRDLLAHPLDVSGRPRRYRFPESARETSRCNASTHDGNRPRKPRRLAL